MEAKSSYHLGLEPAVPWAASGAPGASELAEMQPMEDDELVGGCMASTSSASKPGARGLRKHSEYFLKLSAVPCHQAPSLCLIHGQDLPTAPSPYSPLAPHPEVPLPWGSPAPQPQAMQLLHLVHTAATAMSPAHHCPRGHCQEQPAGPQQLVPGAPHLGRGSSAEQSQAKVTFLGWVAPALLAESCKSCHGKRKCCSVM